MLDSVLSDSVLSVLHGADVLMSLKPHQKSILTDICHSIQAFCAKQQLKSIIQLHMDHICEVMSTSPKMGMEGFYYDEFELDCPAKLCEILSKP